MKCEKWSIKRLEDIAEINPRTPLKKGSVAKKIAMENVLEFNRKISGYEITNFKSGTKFKNSDTIMARITPSLENGKTAYVDILDDDEIAFGSTEFFVLRAKSGKADPKFIYYLSISEDFRRVAIQSMTGTSGRQRAQKDSLLNYELSTPNLKEQRKIGAILSLYDEKIELNNSMITNLEELAQTLFKRWFVDFEFPNEEGKPYKSSGGKMVESELGMIPEGWKIKELNDISKEIICGKTPKTSVKEYYGGSLPFITIPDMHSQVFALNTARYLTEEGQKSQMKKTLPPNSICVSCIATPGLVMLTCVPSQTNQQINSVIPYAEDTYFLYLTLKNMSNLIKELGSGGSTTLNLNKTQFSKIKITYPIQGIREKFNEKIESLFSKIFCLQKENKTLINMRDTILPKLLSGELELPDDMEVTDDVPVS